MPNVAVLISSYNGSSYIEEQLNSIFEQRCDFDIHVFIRDDGSTDNTCNIIDQSPHRARITLMRADNVGAKESFFELIKTARYSQFEYYALCDQDDYWLTNKLQRAVSCLQTNRPSFYSSAVTVTNSSLKIKGRYIHKGRKSFVSTFLLNYVTGCTCVFNRQFLDSIIFPIDMNSVRMHDWWLAVHAAAIGAAVYDRESHILYRQHSNNVVGLSIGCGSLYKLINNLIKRLTGTAHLRIRELTYAQVRHYGECAEDLLMPREACALQKFLNTEGSIRARLTFAFEYSEHFAWYTTARYIFFG